MRELSRNFPMRELGVFAPSVGACLERRRVQAVDAGTDRCTLRSWLDDNRELVIWLRTVEKGGGVVTTGSAALVAEGDCHVDGPAKMREFFTPNYIFIVTFGHAFWGTIAQGRLRECQQEFWK